MSEPVWLHDAAVIAVHKSLIAEHGGIAELRDRNLLGSALARPRNRHAYQPDASMFDLAASYAYGLARDHAFVDGNKRIAITAVAMFLKLNGYAFRPGKADAVMTVLRLAAGDIEEAELAAWIRANTQAA